MAYLDFFGFYIHMKIEPRVKSQMSVILWRSLITEAADL